jgi:hypothetical protein
MKHTYRIKVVHPVSSRKVVTLGSDGREIASKTYSQERWLNVMVDWFMKNCNWLRVEDGYNIWEDK